MSLNVVATDQIAPAGWDLLLQQLGDSDHARGLGYERLHARLCTFFRWKGSPHPDELADMTINRVAQKLVGGEQVRIDVSRFALGVARYVLKEDHARETQKLKALRKDVAPASTSESVEHEVHVGAVEHCLARLDSSERELIRTYYQSHGKTHIRSRRTLAGRLGISLNALRLRAGRIRTVLERCVQQQLDCPPETPALMESTP